MANKSAVLAVRIISDERGAVKGFDNTGNAAEGMGTKIGKMGPALLAFGAVAVGAAIKVGKALYEIGETFDDVEDTIRIGTGAAGEDLDGLVESAKNIGTTVPIEFEKIGPAVADVNTRLGLTGETLETVTSQYLEASRILGEDVDINKTSAAFSAFKIEGEGVIDAMDTMFRVSQETGVGMNELADSVVKQAPALDMLGFSYEESIALIGSLDKAGMDADKTVAAMSKGLVTLAKKGEEPQEAFKRVSSEIEEMVKAGDSVGAIDLANKLFGQKGATSFIGSIESGVMSVEALNSVIEGSGDGILELGAETADAAEKWQLLKNKALVALEPLGTLIFNGVGKALDWVLELVDGIDFGAFMEGQTWISDLAGSFMEVVESIRGFLIPYLDLILPVVKSVFNTVIALIDPFLQIISGLFQVFGGILSGDWTAVWEGIQTVITGAKEFITTLITGLVEAVQLVWGTAWEWVKTKLGEIVEGIVAKVVSFGTSIQTSISNGMNAVKTFWANAWNGMITALTGKITTLVNKVKTIPTKIKSGIGNLTGLLKQAGKDAIQGLINGIGAMGSFVTDAAKNIASNVVGGIKNFLGIKSPSRVLHQAGEDSGSGLRNGLLAKAQSVWKAARSLGAKARDGVAEALNRPLSIDSLKFGAQTGEGYLKGLLSIAPKVENALAGYSIKPFRPSLAAPAPVRPVAGDTYNITVTGALDPVAVAKQIEKILKGQSRRVGTVKIGRNK